MKAVRRTAEETNLNFKSKGPMKKVASTEELRGSEEEKWKGEERKQVLMAQVCNLCRQLENLNM